MKNFESLQLFLCPTMQKIKGIPSIPAVAILYTFVASGKLEELMREELGLDVKIETVEDEFSLSIKASKDELQELTKNVTSRITFPLATKQIQIARNSNIREVIVYDDFLFYLKNILNITGQYSPATLLKAVGHLARTIQIKTTIYLPSLIEVLTEKDLFGSLVVTSQLDIDILFDVNPGNEEAKADIRCRMARGESFIYKTRKANFLCVPTADDGKTIWCLRLLKEPAPDYVKTLQLLEEITKVLAPFMPSILPKIANLLNECRDITWKNPCRIVADILSLVVISLGPEL